MVGNDATFAVVAANGKMPYIYQWQCQNTDGEWEKPACENEAQLTLMSLTAMDNGAQFRCIVGDGYGNTVTSNPARLKVVAQPPRNWRQCQAHAVGCAGANDPAVCYLACNQAPPQCLMMKARLTMNKLLCLLLVLLILCVSAAMAEQSLVGGWTASPSPE